MGRTAVAPSPPNSILSSGAQLRYNKCFLSSPRHVLPPHLLVSKRGKCRKGGTLIIASTSLGYRFSSTSRRANVPLSYEAYRARVRFGYGNFGVVVLPGLWLLWLYAAMIAYRAASHGATREKEAFPHPRARARARASTLCRRASLW